MIEILSEDECQVDYKIELPEIQRKIEEWDIGEEILGNFSNWIYPSILENKSNKLEELQNLFDDLDKIPHNLANDIYSFFDNQNKCSPEFECLLGYGMAFILLEKKQDALDYNFIDMLQQHPYIYWGCYHKLTEELEENKEKVINCFAGIINKVSSESENYIVGHRNQGKDIQRYYSEWNEDANIANVWKQYKWNHYSIDCLPLTFIKILANNCMKNYVDILSGIRNPSILNNLLYSSDIKNDREIIISILKHAPSVLDSDDNYIWNKKLLAPMILDVAMHHTTELIKKIAKDITHNELTVVSDFFKQIGIILRNKDDGAFLAVNYIINLQSQLIINKNPAAFEISKLTHDVYINFIDKICDAFSGTLFPADLWTLLYLDFPNKNQEQIKDFIELGQIIQNDSHSFLDILLTQIMLLPAEKDKKEEFLELFKVLLTRKDPSFNVVSGINNQFPETKHYCIAQLFLEIENPFDYWQEIWTSFNAAQHRLAYEPYGETAREIRNNMQFLLIIGIVITQYLLDDSVDKAKKGWGIIWNHIFDNFIKTGELESRFFERIIPYHLTLGVIIEKHNSEWISEQIKMLAGEPMLAYSSIQQLLNNGLSKEMISDNLLLRKVVESVCDELINQIENNCIKNTVDTTSLLKEVKLLKNIRVN